MRLRRSRRDAETLTDLVVREPCGNQLDDFSLPLRQIGRRASQDLVHGADANNATAR